MNPVHDRQHSLDTGQEASIQTYISDRESLFSPLASVSADAVRDTTESRRISGHPIHGIPTGLFTRGHMPDISIKPRSFLW
jgi:hypothetical protein